LYDVHPISPLGREPGYFGLPTVITFTHAGRTVVQRCLVVLSGPMRHALRACRTRHLYDLRVELAAVRAKIGQKRYRSVKEVQARANTCRRPLPVGPLLSATAFQTADGQSICAGYSIDWRSSK
jgi:hypothetical protein